MEITAEGHSTVTTEKGMIIFAEGFSVSYQ